MKISLSTLNFLAQMICGGSGGSGGYNWPNFPYRSSYYLTEFFRNCNLPYQHDGSTRQSWVYSILEQLNNKESDNAGLPSDEMITVIQQLIDPIQFERADKDHQAAVTQVNKALERDGLQMRLLNGQYIMENLNTRVSSHNASGRLMSREDIIRRQAFEKFLDVASEDQFTEQLLARLFAQLGFERVIVSGHRDKQMEYGKDVWMRYRLPTGHQLYVGVQVKIGRIHSSGSDISSNISGILAQLSMAMDYPVFDNQTNSNHLLDHVFLVSSGEITKQARNLLSQSLVKNMRRNILFMDREEILTLCIEHSLPLPDSSDDESSDEEIPF